MEHHSVTLNFTPLNSIDGWPSVIVTLRDVNVVMLIFEPGDATRYCLTLSRMTQPQTLDVLITLNRHETSGFPLSDVIGGVTFLHADIPFLQADDVRALCRSNPHTAAVIIEILRVYHVEWQQLSVYLARRAALDPRRSSALN